MYEQQPNRYDSVRKIKIKKQIFDLKAEIAVRLAVKTSIMFIEL